MQGHAKLQCVQRYTLSAGLASSARAGARPLRGDQAAPPSWPLSRLLLRHSGALGLQVRAARRRRVGAMHAAAAAQWAPPEA